MNSSENAKRWAGQTERIIKAKETNAMECKNGAPKEYCNCYIGEHEILKTEMMVNVFGRDMGRKLHCQPNNLTPDRGWGLDPISQEIQDWLRDELNVPAVASQCEDLKDRIVSMINKNTQPR